MTAPIHIIGHQASRSGATKVLLALLRHADHAGVPFEVEFLSSGPLEAEFKGLGAANDARKCRSAVLVNGSDAAAVLLDHHETTPTAVYVHEDGQALDQLSGDARHALTVADRVLCVSDRVGNQLVALGVDRERLGVLPPVVTPAAVDAGAVQRARGLLGAGDGEPIVLGCGAPARLKGADLFVELSRHVAGAIPSARFGWIGWRSRSFGRVLDHDVVAAGLTARFRWLGELDDVHPFLAAADVLVSTSRRDALPVVPLEAALLGTPTAGFAIGGLVDLAGAGAARVVPFPDTIELARTAAGLLTSPGGAEVADAGRRLVERDRRIEVVGPRFLDELHRLVTARDRMSSRSAGGRT